MPTRRAASMVNLIIGTIFTVISIQTKGLSWEAGSEEKAREYRLGARTGSVPEAVSNSDIERQRWPKISFLTGKQ